MDKIYDVVLKGGLVIDPSQKIYRNMDLAISGEQIVCLADNIDAAQAKRTINCAGKIVTPGLIDDHVHCYHNMRPVSLSPDRAGVYGGVTTIVDAGSAGPGWLFGFRNFIVEPAKTNVYCLVNVGMAGLVYAPTPGVKSQTGWYELNNWNDLNADYILEKVKENRDIVLGIKIRAFGPLFESDGIKPVEIAKNIAVDAELPLVVHFGVLEGKVSDALTPQILDVLEKGDILAHLYTAKPGRVIEPTKPIMKELQKARDRGVLFDMSHGWYNFSFEAARYGLAEGILPDIISSDLAGSNVFGPVYGLCETMSKMMALGLSLEQAVKMTTLNPAEALHIADRHGSLEPGRVADISVLELLKTKHVFNDSYGATLQGDLLIPVFTIKSGSPVA